MRFRKWIHIAYMIIALVIVRQLSFSATAQAGWTIDKMTFESRYPAGFVFRLKATSSGGKITDATIIYRTSPKKSFRYPGTISSNGEIHFEYDTKIREGLPQWIGIEYWWMLTDTSGNVYETEHKTDEYADNTRKWNRAESDDIIVFWEGRLPQSTGAAVIRAMEKQREFYRRNWGALLPYKPRAILYRDEKPWIEWYPADAVKMVQGLTSDDWGGTVQRFAYSVNEFAYGVVLHEVAHLYQQWNGGLYSRYIWFYEGNATYFELHRDYNYLNRARQIAQSGKMPSLQSDDLGYSDYRDAYDIGFAFWTWLTTAYGENAHYQVWKLIHDGKTVTEALELVTESNFIDMETAFRKWLGMRNPTPPTLVVLPTLQFPPTRAPKQKPTVTP